jgi:hypothetical protein
MAKPNYAFAKRQRDLAKKQKKEEKKLRKASGAPEGGENTAGEQGADPAEPVAEQDAGQGVEQGGNLAQDKVTDQA